MVGLGVPQVPRVEIVRVGLEVLHLRPRRNHGVPYSEPRFDSLDDSGGDFVLDREDVLSIAIEAFRPELMAARHLGQLRRDAQAAARCSHAAFE